MNARILNRDFKHPEDGWYQIEVLGEHANRRSQVVQVIDGVACEGIVNRFNEDAERAEFPGMLIDHEHFKHDVDKESRAYGWLMRLQNRRDGIYGEIKWTRTGREAVDSGDYRFFSTEYDPRDLQVLNRGEKPARVRPTRLDGLTLTNVPNNKGGKPITNRLQNGECRMKNEEFRGAAGASAGNKQTEGNKTMKSVASKLGLSADASEEAVLAEVVKVVNRATEAEGKIVPLEARVSELETANGVMVKDQIAVELDAAGVKEEKVRNRLVPILQTLKNRQERQEFLADVIPAKQGGEAAAPGKVLNRGEAKTPAAAGGEKSPGDGQEAMRLVNDYKIKNRCSFEDAWSAVKREKPELFRVQE